MFSAASLTDSVMMLMILMSQTFEIFTFRYFILLLPDNPLIIRCQAEREGP